MDAKERNERKKENIIQNIRNELKKKISNKEHLLIESDRAVVVKADYPKAQYHFRVVAKEDIADVTKLSSDHLPLLDHMMDLAVQIIEKQDHLPSRNFRIGFKADPFWDRLNMHVISDDFYSQSMKRIKHWNSFNTELFMPFQQAYIMLSSEGAIEPLSEEESEKLKFQVPLHCNQCDFESPLLLGLKAHLYTHWQQKESERQTNKKMEKIVKLLDEAKLEDNAKPEAASLEEPAISSSTSASSSTSENLYGPTVNLMNRENINNPFRGTPPRFGIAAAPVPQRAGNPFGYAPRPQRAGNPFARAPRPRQGVYSYGYSPRPQQGGPPTQPFGNFHPNMVMVSAPMGPPRFPPPNPQPLMDPNTVFAQLNQQHRFARNIQQNQRPRGPHPQQNQRPRGPHPQQHQRPRVPNYHQNQVARAPNEPSGGPSVPRAPCSPEKQPQNPPQLTYDPNQTGFPPKNKPKYYKKKPAANAGKPASK
ncbi:aprataxin-like protein [Drosophila obscura]|uniref:aprataxin-like protein n=1 Tax=Drosophila obscura TaxID=7282 RepID=UPI001BB22671|nr:aprataxin-like protein [Drosophila obscura]